MPRLSNKAAAAFGPGVEIPRMFILRSSHCNWSGYRSLRGDPPFRADFRMTNST